MEVRILGPLEVRVGGRPLTLRAGLPRKLLVVLAILVFAEAPLDASWIWVEGEKPTRSAMNRHPWWYDLVQRDQLSGGDFISNFHAEPGVASYRVVAPAAGTDAMDT